MDNNSNGSDDLIERKVGKEGKIDTIWHWTLDNLESITIVEFQLPRPTEPAEAIAIPRLIYIPVWDIAM